MTFGVGTAWMMFYNGVLHRGLGGSVRRGGRPVGVLAPASCRMAYWKSPPFLLAARRVSCWPEGMIRARPWPRSEELARVGKEALLLVSGCVPLMAMAGVLEIGVARAPDWFFEQRLEARGGDGLWPAVRGVCFAAGPFAAGRPAAAKPPAVILVRPHSVASQHFAVPSWLADAIRRPSALTATLPTASVWPLSVSSS